MNKQKLTKLFQKYVDQTCTENEYKEFMDLVRDDEHKVELDLLMENHWNAPAGEQLLSGQKAAQLFEEIMVSAEEIEPGRILRPIRNYRLWLTAVAASIALAVFGLFYYQSDKTKGSQESAQLKHLSKHAEREHRKIKLPDGSTVVLNNNSTLEFPESFSGASREVRLRGEGYFDIKHDEEKPFIVYTGSIRTTVLGTAFNINAYDNDHHVIVTVTRGKVRVDNEEGMMGIIVPNQQIVISKKEKKTELFPVVARKVVEWQEKDLFFDEVTMEEATRELSQYFNVKIRFATEASKGCRFTATFLKGESLEEILQVITSFNHAEYKRIGEEILIFGKGCK